MRKFHLFALVLATLALAPMLAAADFGIRAGRYDDSDEEFVGAEVAFDLGSLTVVPNVEYSLEEDVTSGTANLDVTVDIFNAGSITPYLGAGVGLAYAEAGGATQTDMVGNLIGGVIAKLDVVQPYVQVKYFRLLGDDDEVGDDSDLALTIGLRF